MRKNFVFFRSKSKTALVFFFSFDRSEIQFHFRSKSTTADDFSSRLTKISFHFQTNLKAAFVSVFWNEFLFQRRSKSSSANCFSISNRKNVVKRKIHRVFRLFARNFHIFFFDRSRLEKMKRRIRSIKNKIFDWRFCRNSIFEI